MSLEKKKKFNSHSGKYALLTAWNFQWPSLWSEYGYYQCEYTHTKEFNKIETHNDDLKLMVFTVLMTINLKYYLM